MEEVKTKENTDVHKHHWLKTYIPLFLGESISLLGSIIVQFSIVWWLTETTGSATILATGSIFIMLPGALIGPFLATLVDRMDRRWVLVITDAIISLGTIFLMLMFWLDTIQIWHIFLVFAISSVFGNMQWSAVAAVTSTIVPEEQLQRVQGANTTLQSVFNIGGPVLGATLMGLLPIYAVLSVDMITAVIAIALLWVLKIPKVVKSTQEPVSPAGMWRDFKDGFRFVTHHRGFLYLIIAFALMNFFLEPLFTFFPLLVTDYFKKGVFELSLIDTFWGIGMVIGGLIMSAWGGFKRKIKSIILGNILFGIFVGVIAIAPPEMFWLALVGVFLMAMSNSISNAPIMALLQTKVPKEIQGRVFSLTQSLVTITIPLSLLIAGPIADVTGVHIWYWIGAVGMLAICGLQFLKPIYTLEDQEFVVPASPAQSAE